MRKTRNGRSKKAGHKQAGDKKTGKQPPPAKRVKPPPSKALPTLQAIERLIPLAMICLDAQGRVTSWNKAAEQLLGWTEAETLGRELPYVPSGSERESDVLWRRVMRGEGSLGTEIRRVRKDGRPVDLQLWTTIIRDKAGALVGTLGLLADITQQKQAAAEKRTSEQRLRALIDAEPECVKVTSADGILLDMNPAGLAMIEADSLEQVRGRSVLPIVAPEHREAFASFTQRAAEGAPGLLQFEIVGLKGTRRWMETRAVPFGEKAGGPAAVLAITHDITHRKQTEESLRLFSALLDHVKDSIEIIDPRTGRFVGGNKKAWENLGYTRDELLLLTVPDIDPLVTNTVFADHMRRLRESGDSVTLESIHRRKDGTTFPVEVSVQLIRHDRNNEYLVAIVRDITERKQAEDRLRQSEEQYRGLVDTMQEGLGVQDQHGLITYVNQRLCEMVGYAREELIGNPAAVLFDEENKKILREQMERRRKGERQSFEIAWRRKDGGTVDTIVTPNPRFDANGNFVESAAVVTDITERKRLEEELRQAQKMEAVGRLAGGIAHDFNNLLTIIGGYSDILLRKLASRDPLGQYVRDIKKASGRATSLTRQLLAFSRRQVLEPKVLNLNDSILAMDPMLRRLIGEHIELTLALSPDLGPVMADPSQIEQVIMNLALNARDAMPDGGRLTITTANAAFDQVDAGKPPGIPPGAYAQLIVADTGQGMDKATLAHLFEPFFTTKGVGKGTGLGLATVYGIVAQSNGAIWATSEPGQGATLTVCLPQTTQKVAQTTEPSVPLEATPRLPRGSKTILLAEDEDAVRALTRDVLEEEGYRVLEARNGVDALALAAQHAGPIHLLLTDVVMPQMGGRALADRLAADRPGIKVLYMSGYIEDPNLQRGILSAQAAFLPKPALPELLLRKVLAVLDASD